MGTQAAIRSNPSRNSLLDSSQIIQRGKQILSAETAALNQLEQSLDHAFSQSVHCLLCCTGSVVVTGIGKAGIVASKLSASLASTGTPSHFMHPADALHGDLGCVRSEDIAVVLSYSGETDEILRLLPSLKQVCSAVIAITSHRANSLARMADVTLALGKHREACALGLAPTTTTTAMMGLADALALVVSELRGFTKEQFAKLHPAGSLGRQLTSVKDVMRPIADCRIANESEPLRKVLVTAGRPGRRSGAIMLINDEGRLSGIFTDSDLARLLERSQDHKLNEAINGVMSRRVTTIDESAMLPDALHILAEKKISELPVVNAHQQPIGMIDVTDLISGDWVGADWVGTDHSGGVAFESPSDPTHVPRIIPLKVVCDDN